MYDILTVSSPIKYNSTANTSLFVCHLMKVNIFLLQIEFFFSGMIMGQVTHIFLEDIYNVLYITLCYRFIKRK